MLWSIYQNQCCLLNLLKTTKRKVKHVRARITYCPHQLQNSRMTAVKNVHLLKYKWPVDCTLCMFGVCRRLYTAWKVKLVQMSRTVCRITSFTFCFTAAITSLLLFTQQLQLRGLTKDGILSCNHRNTSCPRQYHTGYKPDDWDVTNILPRQLQKQFTETKPDQPAEQVEY